MEKKPTVVKTNTVLLWLLLVELFCLSPQLIHAQNYSLVSTTIPALTNAKTQWADFNNDGLLDLFISGTTTVSGLHTAVYISNGDNTFNVIALPGLTDLTFAINDYNKDGFADLLLSGITIGGVRESSVYKNNGGTSFTKQILSLMPLSKGGVVWHDLNNDGYLDIVLTGLDENTTEHTVVYRGTESGYTNVSTTLPAISNGELIVVDANNDGLNEILLTGLNAQGNIVTQLFTATLNLSFVPYASLSKTFAFTSVAAGDYNKDGFVDLFLSGLSDNALEPATSVFQNNTINGFTEVTSSLKDVSASSISLSDLNNDGLLDVVLTGLDVDTEKYFVVYKGTPTFTFIDTGINLPAIYNGQVTLGDYDNDGDLDLFQLGNSDIAFQSNLFTSDLSVVTPNQVPAAPSNLQAGVAGKNVTLSWNASSDNITDANSISYALYMSKDQNGSNLFISPLAGVSTGKRRTIGLGNAEFNLTKTFNNLPQGRYYWSVQAIDAGLSGSNFATEQTFSICDPINLGEDQIICENDEVELNMGLGTDVVNWYSKSNGLLLAGAFSYSFTVAETDTIIAELIKPFGCSVTDTVIVKMSPLPLVDLGNDVSLCYNEIIELELPNALDSVNWLSVNEILLEDSRSYTHTVLLKDTIIAQVFSAFKCVAVDSLIIDVIPLPVFSLGSDLAICEKENVELTVSGTWAEVNWRYAGGATLVTNNPTLSYDVLQTATIEAEVEDANGCTNTDEVIIEALPLPIIDLGADIEICYQESTLLELPPGSNTINWYDINNQLLASGQRTYLKQVFEKDTLIVEAIDGNSCVQRDSIIVDVIPLPVVNLGADQALCFGSPILLNAGTGFQRVDWLSKKDNILLNPNSFFFNYTVNVTDTIIAKVVSLKGCINYDSVRLEMKELPDYTLGNDFSVCKLEKTQLSIAGNWAEVQWFGPGNVLLDESVNDFELTVEESTTIRSVVKGANNCIKSDTVSVTMLNLPEFDLGEDIVHCVSDELSLEANVPTATEFNWYTNLLADVSTQNKYSFTAEESIEIFLLTKDIHGCEYKDSINVQVNVLPQFTIEGPATICQGLEANLKISFSDWTTISWYMQEQEILFSDVASIIIEPQTTTEIFARLTDRNSCTSTASLIIQFNNNPIVNAGEDGLICFGEAVTLGDAINTAATFQWSPAASLSSASAAQPLAQPTTSTTYTLTLTDENGCIGNDQVYIEVNPEIVVNAGENANVCIGESFTLGGQPTASGSSFPYTYQWTSPEGILQGDNPNPQITPAVSALYYVFVSSGECEVLYDSIQVNVLSLPIIEVGPDQSVGAGAAVTLSAFGGVSYQWSPQESLDNANTQFPQAAPQVTTVYTVVVSDENGCESSGEVKVLVQNTLFIPKLFTPNGDGVNDSFKLFGSGVASLKFSIHDQYGNSVYYTENIENAFTTGWDGTAGGKQLANDIYFWTLEGTYYTGEPLQFEGRNKGVIKLMR